MSREQGLAGQPKTSPRPRPCCAGQWARTCLWVAVGLCLVKTRAKTGPQTLAVKRPLSVAASLARVLAQTLSFLTDYEPATRPTARLPVQDCERRKGKAWRQPMFSADELS